MTSFGSPKRAEARLKQETQHYPKGCPQLGSWLAVPRLVGSFGCAAACRAGLVLKIEVGERLSRCRPGR